MEKERKESSLGTAEAKEDVLPGVPDDGQYDEVFGEITEDGPNYRSVGAPILRVAAACPS